MAIRTVAFTVHSNILIIIATKRTYCCFHRGENWNDTSTSIEKNEQPSIQHQQTEAEPMTSMTKRHFNISNSAPFPQSKSCEYPQIFAQFASLVVAAAGEPCTHFTSQIHKCGMGYNAFHKTHSRVAITAT